MPARWMPLPSAIKTSSTAATQSSSNSSAKGEDRAEAERQVTAISPSAQSVRTRSTARSLSTDVSSSQPRHEDRTEGRRRHTECIMECPGERAEDSRWEQEARKADGRQGGEAVSFADDVGSSGSPLARIASSSCAYTKSAASRWMTFARNPSPCPMPRVNPDRKASCALVEGSASAPPQRKTWTTPYAASGWQPIRKFVSPALARKSSPPSSTPPASTTEGRPESEAISQGNLAPDPDQQSPRTSSSLQVRERSTRLSQRIRDLYDFKTENEWPTRVMANSAEKQDRVWISKSSSEEEKFGTSIGKNSQELEFNDRRAMFEMRNCRCVRKPRYGTSGSDTTIEAATAASFEEEVESEVFEDSQDERWRLFNERLRYSEDLGQERLFQRQQRRTFSDDYEVKRRRDLRLGFDARNSLTERSRSRELGASYVEIESIKRNSRASEASYVSVDSCLGRKQSSDECGAQMRIFQQNENSTIGMRKDCNDDDRKERVGMMDDVSMDRMILERHKRASTRYKVYLT